MYLVGMFHVWSVCSIYLVGMFHVWVVCFTFGWYVPCFGGMFNSWYVPYFVGMFHVWIVCSVLSQYVPRLVGMFLACVLFYLPIY